MFSFPTSTLDRGMSTAEYAVGTIAAVAIAGVLYLIATSEPVSAALTTVFVDALQPRH
ncbi:DUF4244 domain-containing protein [Nocardiopsis sp. NPDC058789]|uniref:DUF4244 domain-containing protein n=1 Tax=Nocardiopsis eucommiae TaxID=2831970 RepID=A0A975QKL1_9ACTN|nr:DUF4244 domain-containing protein [Nocardiopsis eucommiae]